MGKRTDQAGAVIHRVDKGSIGDEIGLVPGDRIIEISGQHICDLIDYSLLQAEEELELLILRADGEYWDITVEKDEDEGLGLQFEEAVFDGIRPCGNRCVFCFVDQMPKGQRPTLYIKDDDYRLSFLQGSYITLTNLRPADWQRIEDLRLSPLYVSVHATDPEVRQRLLGHARAGQIMDDLKRLQAKGIQLHTQAVLCPGINNGPVLDQTLEELYTLWPTVQSLAVVPVGLTSKREGLYPLRKFSSDEAKRVLETVHARQKLCLDNFGTRWVWPTDEFYLQAGWEIPAGKIYEDYAQLENGVGLWRLFSDEFEVALHENRERLKKAQGSFGIITGKDAAGLLEKTCETLRRSAPNVELTVYSVENKFFGPEVTVAGLVVGEDIISMLSRQMPFKEEKLFLPAVMLRHGETVFLDGTTLKELQSALQIPVEVLDVDGSALVSAVCTSKEEK